MTADTQQLARLRRRAQTKAITVNTRLIGRRPTPWRDWEPISRQLCALGFRDVDHPDQTVHELEVMIWFLNQWLEMLPVTEGIIWSDDPGEHRG
jgi:hypothetical protein